MMITRQYSIIVVSIGVENMHRFIVCGKYDNGSLRVMDTTDNTVESVTVEQLKVIQTMGYSILFDSSYDYIYRMFIYNTSKKSLLDKMPYTKDMRKRLIDYTFFQNMLVQLVYCNEKVVLMIIKQSGDSYKMFVNDDIRRLIDIKVVDSLNVYEFYGEEVGVVFTKIDKNYALLFDLECNYLETIDMD